VSDADPEKKTWRFTETPYKRNEMTTDKIDNAQRTAAKVAGVAGLLGFALVFSAITFYSPAPRST